MPSKLYDISFTYEYFIIQSYIDSYVNNFDDHKQMNVFVDEIYNNLASFRHVRNYEGNFHLQ